MKIVSKAFDELSAAELYGILKLRCEVFVVEQNCPYPDIDGNDPAARHFFAEIDGKVVCCCRALPRGVTFESCAIGRLASGAEFRGKGYARELMQEAIRYILEEMKEREIMLSAQTYIIPFYESLGFEAVSDVYLEDGIPHRDMRFRVSDTDARK